ncbi:C-type natriuretic peptide 4-like [Triplophysa dalaica]|uniref:C-type natriuretic peptide 4-like n=1 Tax=Triplophysa dalaica TaxID=1582913 RepID=UPI0024DF8BE6|nr:C-type natriuretic peptide 4-like [Triplophysa dalaica]
MDMIYIWFCGLCMVSLSLYAKPFTTVQYKSTKALPAENRSARPARNETVEARGSNRSRAAKEPHELNANAKGAKQRPASGDQSNSRKKQPPKNREKRKNCFGFKMDRISDISGMGCKND